MTVVKTIGTGAGLNVTPDYATIAAWISYMATTNFGSGAGVLTDHHVGRVLWNSSANELTTTADTTITGITPGAYTITLEAGDANGNAGGSFRDNPNVATNPLRYTAANGACVRQTSGGTNGLVVVRVNNVIIRNLQFRYDSTVHSTINCDPTATSGLVIDSCIIHQYGAAGGDPLYLPAAGNNAIVRNCAIIIANCDASNHEGIYLGDGMTVMNCTLVCSTTAGTTRGFRSAGGTQTITNCAILGSWDTDLTNVGGTVNTSYCATNFSSGTSALGGSNHQYDCVSTDEIYSVTNGSEDLRLKPTAPKCRNLGTTTGAPATDIRGATRPQ